MSPARPDMPLTIDEHAKPLPPSANSILSPERRTRSYDSNLDQLKQDQLVEPLTPTKKKGGIFGSFEKGLDQVRLMLTPNKKKRQDQGTAGDAFSNNSMKIFFVEPRKIKAVSNVSRISRKDPKSVLKNIHQVVSH